MPRALAHRVRPGREGVIADEREDEHQHAYADDGPVERVDVGGIEGGLPSRRWAPLTRRRRGWWRWRSPRRWWWRLERHVATPHQRSAEGRSLSKASAHDT